ncbi:hypothetical protein Huta_2653 [Halorhabdus utahensis DSM 12940]|uniref:Lipoprotein n=1 Tax=Halorhabdus utahensis (strain DSM 12940 / JCM 11049 / AX-2) TaxID=519442 RepID=C7NQ88_HALUD|nr:hypothetical protein [Halorhabdus utahensis]ACV12814.1 hypothetical protein Huta_2653 [Halorhabdus utahensis DSM 12940]
MASTRKIVLLVCAALLVFGAGCEQLDHTPDPSVKFDGNITASEGSFEIEGHFYRSVGNEYVYENVMVHLLDEREERIESVHLGTLDERLPVSVSSSSIPAYVIVDSPDFWQQNNFAVEYFEYKDWKGLSYDLQWASNRSELPAQP